MIVIYRVCWNIFNLLGKMNIYTIFVSSHKTFEILAALKLQKNIFFFHLICILDRSSKKYFNEKFRIKFETNPFSCSSLLSICMVGAPSSAHTSITGQFMNNYFDTVEKKKARTSIQKKTILITNRCFWKFSLSRNLKFVSLKIDRMMHDVETESSLSFSSPLKSSLCECCWMCQQC